MIFMFSRGKWVLISKYAFLVLLLLVLPAHLLAQQPPLPTDTGQKIRDFNERLTEEAHNNHPTKTAGSEDYHIGPEDLLDISVFEVPELSRTVRVSATGEISLPLIGTLKVAGENPIALEQMLRDTLRKTYLNDPQVVVFIREFHSDPVSVMGAVKMPGNYQIQTRKTLVEILAMAQGFTEGPARLPGRDIVVTRGGHYDGESDTLNHDARTVALGADPPAASLTGNPKIVDVPIKELMNSGDPKWNISIYPGDVVKVVPAGTVYVAGDVARPGGFPLTDFDNISVIQALSIAGGPLRTAVRKNSVIIRRDAQGNRLEQKVDLARVLKGQDPDVMLGANDILFLPGSASKAAILRTLENTIQMATGMMIYNRPF
jgi:polysaccharide export outer membrane protein